MLAQAKTCWGLRGHDQRQQKWMHIPRAGVHIPEYQKLPKDAQSEVKTIYFLPDQNFPFQVILFTLTHRD